MKYKFVYILIMFFILGFSNEVVLAENQEELTIMGFISAAEKDYRLENHQELLDYLKDASSSTPYLDKVEIRTNTEDFELAKQKYALRFYTKGFGETRYNNQLTETIADAYNLEHDVYFNKALLKRYTLVLEYLETVDLLRVYNELEAVYSDRIDVLKKQSGTLSFDVGEYIRAENQITELQLDLVKAENKLTGILHKIHLTADTETKVVFDRKDLIEVNEIVQVLNTLEIDPDLDNIYLRDRKNKIEREQLKYNIEKAQQRDYLSYVEVEFDRDNFSKEKKNAYSLDFAFKLPFINSDQEDVNRRKVNYIEEKLQYEDEKRDTYERVKSTLRSINRYIDQYQILAERKQTDDAQNPLNVYMRMEGVNPLSLLEMRESIIKYDSQQSQTYTSILYEYIELMDLMGKLSEKPLRCYISKGMEPLNER